MLFYIDPIRALLMHKYRMLPWYDRDSAPSSATRSMPDSNQRLPQGHCPRLIHKLKNSQKNCRSMRREKALLQPTRRWKGITSSGRYCARSSMSIGFSCATLRAIAASSSTTATASLFAAYISTPNKNISEFSTTSATKPRCR